MPSFNDDKRKNKGAFYGKRRRGGGSGGGGESKGKHEYIKKKRYHVGTRLKDVDIGITEYLGDHPGFKGTIKERYSDFHVNEITLDGEVAKLSNMDLPKVPADAEIGTDVLETIPPDIIAKLEALKTSSDEDASASVDVTNMSKEQRKAIHTLAKQIPDVVSETSEEAGLKILNVKKSSKTKKRSDKRIDWSKLDGKYCHFLLHKVNTDTMTALNQIAYRLRIKSNVLTFNGTKDRRANTTQWVCLRRGDPKRILSAAQNLQGIFVGNFKFSQEQLRLGKLYGNQFRIVLRNVEGTEEDIEKAMVSLRDKGFINYYGLQRFGTIAKIPTHMIGKALLQGKWTEAIDLILKPREGETHRDIEAARKVYQESKDAALAYKEIRKTDTIEASLLYGLSINTESNPQGALDHIPRNIRLMYMHAYQSFIWNHIVSKRIKELGDKPVVGDLVFASAEDTKDMEDEIEDLELLQCDADKDESVPGTTADEEKKEEEMDLNEEEKDNEESEDIPTDEKKKMESPEIPSQTDGTNEEKVNEETLRAKEEKIEDSVESVDEKMKVDDDGDQNPEEDVGKKGDHSKSGENVDSVNDFPSVRILKEEDLPNYTLADIIMPLPGWKVTYPPYAKSWYDEFLTKDDLTSDLKQKNKKYSLSGAYRKILQIPSDISWEFMRYNDKYEDLLLSDVDVLRKRKAPENNPEGKYKALIIKMSLKSSVYATMALREILKCDTSSETQAFHSAENNEEE